MADLNSNNSKSLGRGLSSLLGQDKTNPTLNPVEAPYFPKTKQGVSNQILQIEVDKIKNNPHQPRSEFNEIRLNDLVLSIKEHGVIQPIVVTQTMGGEYELIAGERRLRASKIAGLKKIPAIVRSAKELEKLELSLIENIQRHDLNPIEKALSYKKLIDEFDLTHEQAAKRLGISRSQFSNFIRLLSLPDAIKQGLMGGKISLSQAKVLLEVKDNKQQEQVYKRSIKTEMTVDDVQKEVRKINNRKVQPTKKDPQLKLWEEKLQSKLNTKVLIRQTGRLGGRVEIEFYSEEELDEIIKKIID
ncbi:ParB/RepB/Spo0J family partition protein [Patescibacteria group bacterium]